MDAWKIRGEYSRLREKIERQKWGYLQITGGNHEIAERERRPHTGAVRKRDSQPRIERRVGLGQAKRAIGPGRTQIKGQEDLRPAEAYQLARTIKLHGIIQAYRQSPGLPRYPRKQGLHYPAADWLNHRQTNKNNRVAEFSGETGRGESGSGQRDKAAHAKLGLGW